jgi:AmmeMemoRadiSam system protein B
VTHGTVRREIGDPKNKIILDAFDEWYAPYGNIKPSSLRQFIRQRLDTSMFLVSNKAQQLEHSIEALLPFVQHYNPGIRITPIMVTAMSFERMDSIGNALAPIIEDYIRSNNLTLGKDIAFLCSSDANHYGRDFNNLPFGEDETAHAKGTQQDVRVATSYLMGAVSPDKIKSLTQELQSILWCGKYSVSFGMLASMKIVRDITRKDLAGTLYRYSDTYSEGVLPIHNTGMGVTAVFSLQHWVGFFSAGYEVIDSLAH